MSYCDKSNCGYYYKGEDDDFPCCHCPEGDIAPCEYEDDYYEGDDCDYECGFDPYMGCYTDDC